MTVVAIAKVGYEKTPGDVESVVWFEAGEEIKDAPKEVVEQWKANGSVGDPPASLPSVVAEKEQLEARVAELERQLEEAKNPPKDEVKDANPDASKSTATAKTTPPKTTP